MPFPTYTIATETSTGVVNQALLYDEIDESSAPVPDSMHESSDGAMLTLTYDVTPTSTEQAIINSVVGNHAGTALFSVFQRWENNAAQIAASGVGWVEMLSVKAQPLEAGLYRFAWSMELALSGTGSGTKTRARVRVDAPGNGLSIKGQFITPEDETTYSGYSGYDFLNYSSGERPDVKIDVMAEGGTDDALVRRIKFGYELMRGAV